MKRLICMFAVLALILAAGTLTAPPVPRAEANPPLIGQVYTDKARYAKGEPAIIRVVLNNHTGSPYSGTVKLSFRKLGYPAGSDQSQTVNALAPDTASDLSFTWTPPEEGPDFTGYLIEVSAWDKAGNVRDSAATAVDVSSDWAKFPRYGFVTKYDADLDADNMMWKMKNYHINGVQFYDWQWKHHVPYSPSHNGWPSFDKAFVSRTTLQNMIGAAKKYGMMSMNYNLINGSYDHYWEDGSGIQPSWGLYRKNASGALFQDRQGDWPAEWAATPSLPMFNPADSGWQAYINGKEKDVFDSFGFDGWHIDSLGNRNDTLYDYTGKHVIDLKTTFAPFINKAKTDLGKRLVFNSVGAYGQDEVASGADVDFVYSELWDGDPGNRTYGDIMNLVERSQARTDKAIVFAAYMNYNYRNTIPDGSTGYFNEAGLRLANAAIFSSGASHIELGDGEGMLSNQYYPSQKLVMNDDTKASVLDYYHFLTAYENLLRDQTRRGSGKVGYVTRPEPADGAGYTNEILSTDGGAGTIWTMAKSRPGYEIMHFINLKNNRSGDWRDTDANYPVPPELLNMTVKQYYEGTIGKLWYASPDYEHGKAYELAYTKGKDASGTFITYTLPRLWYWDMVWLEKSQPESGQQYLNDFGDTAVGTVPADWSPQGEGQVWGVRQTAGAGKELHVDAGGVLKYLPGFDTGNYTVEGYVLPASTSGSAAILARMQAGGGFYQLELKDGKAWSLYKYDGGSAWRELAGGPFHYTADTYHYLKLTCSGNRLTVEIDLAGKGTYTDYDAPYYYGSAGLRSGSGMVRFDDIQVTGL